MRKVVFLSCLVAFGLLFPIVLMEAELRIEQRIRKGISIFANPKDRWDAALGWSGREHSIGSGKKPPILVLGDSFTDGLTVPSEKMWFASLREQYPESRIIAYGGLGYGTLQELTVLDKYLADGLRPGLIVVQLCSNDIMNNYRPLEAESYLQRAPGPRPYLNGDEVRIEFARNYEWLLFPLVSYSRLAYRLNERWELSVSQQAKEGKIPTVENEIQRSGIKFQPYRQGVAVTDKLIARIKDHAKGIPLLLMLVDDFEPYTASLRDIAHRYQVPIVNPTHEVKIPADGRLEDGAHLNEVGNKILGDELMKLARERAYLPPI